MNLPRDPAEYQPTVHVLQRKKERPHISGEVISEVIQDGELKEAKRHTKRFTKWIENSFGEHYVSVVIDPFDKEIMTIYCPCDDPTKRACHKLPKP